MNGKLRYICIDGMDKNKNILIFREMRKYLKLNNINLKEIKKTNELDSDTQKKFLEEDSNLIILKSDSVLSFFKKELESGLSIFLIQEKYTEVLRKEREINHYYGSVCFFTIPKSGFKINQNYQSKYCDFFKNINNYSIAEGLNIHPILYEDDDNIFDIKDKILKILKQSYNI